MFTAKTGVCGILSQKSKAHRSSENESSFSFLHPCDSTAAIFAATDALFGALSSSMLMLFPEEMRGPGLC